MRSESTFGVMEALRSSVFHMPRDHLDEDSREVPFGYLSISTLDIF